MKNLKNLVQSTLMWLAAAMMIIILLMALFFQVIFTQKQTRENADATFAQVHQIIEKSTAELETVKAEYKETCLLNAEAISYIIQNSPEMQNTVDTIEQGGNVKEFIQLARKLQVDEIHIFDETGRIFTGTHPQYYNFTFDSGAQMRFFKPMLNDKSLRLCQEITPNTAEGKLVQYSALWSADEKYIVQVGMYPDAVLEVTEKSELSYIFSLLKGNPGVSLYAVDYQSGKIIGSTSGTYNNKSISSVGLDINTISKYNGGAHATVNGVNSYCIFKEIDGMLIGYVIANDQLYSRVGSYSLLLAMCLLVVALVMVWVVKRCIDKYIIRSILATNYKLRAVTNGDLHERVDVQSSQEFSELSRHINSMIRSLLAETDKMSLVLNRTNLHVGVYEYNTNMGNVRFTEHVPEILGITGTDMENYSKDNRSFIAFIDELRREPVPDAENTYRFVGKTEMYIKLEEITNNNAVLGILMDVTEDTVSRKKAEAERDIDLMTGLYNRRGMERRFDALFSVPSDMGCGALIMIDSDNLKYINDTYGHAVGDIYLKYLGDLLANFDAPRHVAARTGGDEFVLLVYGYESDTDVEKALEAIAKYQRNTFITLDDATEIQLHFSYGYELTRGRLDHKAMLSTADVNMYNSKRMRKKAYNERMGQ